jgi:hypothetical protein
MQIRLISTRSRANDVARQKNTTYEVVKHNKKGQMRLISS